MTPIDRRSDRASPPVGNPISCEKKSRTALWRGTATRTLLLSASLIIAGAAPVAAETVPPPLPLVDRSTEVGVTWQGMSGALVTGDR
jgi:hypothetical protein